MIQSQFGAARDEVQTDKDHWMKAEEHKRMRKHKV